MAELVLGPLLRYADGSEATIWVETDSPCEVEVLGFRAPTFEVGGHHYALVIVEGLEPGRPTSYEVRLDGERRWPLPDAPESLITTSAPGRELRIVFGSCRVTLPHEPPYTLPREEDDRGRGHDALYALARRMLGGAGGPESWPHKILMLGDQVYVDEGSPRARERIRARRDVSQPPGLEVADYEEFTWLYHEAWGEPTIRWLLSCVATPMIWDDHDMHDDWNISASWVRDMRSRPWWEERVVGGIASYWVYQHLGNLSAEELRRDELYGRVRAMRGDCWPVLRDFAHRADHQADGTRWSYRRDMGGVRVVVLDSRAGRVLEDTKGHPHEHGRAMIDDDEWEWVSENARGDCEHLVLATSLPLMLAPGLHWAEAWSEAICDGGWGPLGERVGEKLRRAGDLESWAAFQDSFHRVCGLIEEVAAGRRGEPPATIVVVSGDVHHAYVARAGLRRSAGARSRVWQAVCSPFRNELGRSDRAVLAFGASRAGEVAARALAKSAGVEDPDLRWRVEGGPWFDNQMATLVFDGERARLRIDKTVHADPAPDLESVWDSPL